ncbi:hypothetical protein [Burkholderia phage FLC9]|nr:hypothetical protein [Burkholderia phage FLC9]
MKKVGFWYSESEPELPMPEAGITAWRGRSHYMAVLTALQLTMENDDKAANFKPGHSRYQDEYPDADVHHYRGWSHCRICGEMNGTKEFVLGGFTWPQGYRHYLSDHNVEPDPEFKAFLKAFAERHISIAGKPLILE